jgi:hypothetical protein
MMNVDQTKSTLLAAHLWWICEDDNSPCVFSNYATRHLKSDPLRCIRHGALMFSSCHYDGMTKAQVKADLWRALRSSRFRGNY